MYALFIEETERNGAHQQFILVADRVFSRVSDGGKHGLNRWQEVTAESLTNTVVTVDQEPTAIAVTERDLRQIAATGVPSTLAIKAQNAHKRSPETSTSIALSDVIERVHAQDIAEYARDARRTRPIVTAPIAPTAVPVTVVREPVVHAVEAEPQYAMSVIPEESLSTSYVGRTIGGVSDFDTFDYAMRNSLNVLLYGPTGPGKTTSAIAFAAKKRVPVFMVSGTVSLEASQLFGRYIPDGLGGFVWQDGGVTEIVRHGGVLILDEVNFIPSKIATVLFPLLASTRHITLLDHRGETIKAHPDLLIVGTMNPGYAGTAELNAAFRNRFNIQVNWGYDANVEEKLVPSKVLREIASKLRQVEAREELTTPTPTNALMEFIALAKDLGLDFAIANFVNRYDETEQAIVELTFKTYRDNIEADLGIKRTVAEPTQTSDELFDNAIRTLADIDLPVTL